MHTPRIIGARITSTILTLTPAKLTRPNVSTTGMTFGIIAKRPSFTDLKTMVITIRIVTKAYMKLYSSLSER